MQSQNESKEAKVPILMADEADPVLMADEANFRSSDNFQG